MVRYAPLNVQHAAVRHDTRANPTLTDPEEGNQAFVAVLSLSLTERGLPPLRPLLDPLLPLISYNDIEPSGVQPFRYNI